MELEIDKPERYQTRAGDDVVAFYKNPLNILVVTCRPMTLTFNASRVDSNGLSMADSIGASGLDIILKEKRLYRGVAHGHDDNISYQDGIYLNSFMSDEKPSKPYLTWIEGKPETVELVK